MSKNIFYQFLFALCIGVTYINIYELTFGVWLFTLFISFRPVLSVKLLKLILPFFIIIAIACIAGLVNQNSLYESIRDLTYLCKPIIGLLVGYQLCRNKEIKPFETIIYTGALISIAHFGVMFYNIVFHKIYNIHILRHYSGYFSDFEIYSLIAIIFHKKLGVYLSRRNFIFLLLLVSVSSFFYLSRTNFIQFVLFYMIFKGYLAMDKKALIIALSFFLVCGIGYAFLYNSYPSRNAGGIEALMFKLKNMPIEAFKSKVDKDDWADFNDNYRSFENITTVRQVGNAGLAAVTFGKGLGATIDIGRRIKTNEGTYVRHEPILHNAYMTVYLKSGLVGISCMIWFLILMCGFKKSDNYEIQRLNLMLVATGLFLIIANWVLLGLFLKIDNKSIIIGFLLCYREMLLRRPKVDISNAQ